MSFDASFAVVYLVLTERDIRCMAMVELKKALIEIRYKDYRDGRGNFSAQFMLLNRNKKTGGEILDLQNACGCGLPPTCKGIDMVGIMDMETGKRYPVHNRLLFTLNGQEVYWV